MFFPILFSILQICFIPGFIVFIFLNRKSDDSKILFIPVISFGLSLIVNYLIVISLTYFHIYTKLSLIILLSAECIFLAGIFVFHKLNTDSYKSKKMYLEIKHEISLLANRRQSIYDLINLAFFTLSLLLLLSLSIVFIINFGKIFNAWDAIFSWNRWAIDFFNNRLPLTTYHYPQLIPANWSISYVLCGYPLQFITRGLMPLFLIFPVYSFILLGITNRSFAFFSPLILFFLGFNKLNWTDGCVDVPVAFFSILVFICLILINREDRESDKKKHILLSALFACGAAVTKQAGIFTVLIYPLLLFILTKGKFIWTFQRIFKFSLFYLGMLVIIVVPFYYYVEKAIKGGLETSEINFVTNEIFHGASYPERFSNACRLFSDLFKNKNLFIFSMFPFLLSFIDRNSRILNIFFVIPYFIIWSVFFSYDIRNVAIIIPFFCLSIGVGLEIILKTIQTSPLKNESLEK